MLLDISSDFDIPWTIRGKNRKQL